MKKALIRFEDVGPGGLYATEEDLLKLRAIGDYMKSEGVPFHVAMIPRFVNPKTGYDKSIADRKDPFFKSFHATIEHLRSSGGSIGMHGYRHQYGDAVTADGFEFAFKDCTEDCAPDDAREAYLERGAFERSYASSRMREGFQAVRQSGLQVDWFETPHYTASDNQRWILESWVGLFFENDPRAEDNNRLSIRDIDTPLYRGVIYVPTPLYYVDGSKPDAEVERITTAIQDFTEQDLAAFFFHPFLDFPFLKIEKVDGKTCVVYEEQSYLKRLVRAFKKQGFTFVPVLSLVPFVPSSRQTHYFPGDDFEFLTGDVDGDKRSELIVRQRSTGDWYTTAVHLNQYPSRQNGELRPERALSGWLKGDGWQPLVGDFNGDGKADLVMRHAQRGEWKFAFGDGTRFHPDPRLDLQGMAVGEHWVPVVGDFNGNGKDELAVWNRGNGACIVREGTQIRLWMYTELFGVEDVALVGDFNGDGKDDIALWRPSTGEWHVLLSDGTRFLPYLDGKTNGRWLTGWAVGANWQALVGDFDGDGRDDLLVVDAALGEWRVARSMGTHFEPVKGAFKPWAAGTYMQPLVGVFTDDGRAGICARQQWLRDGTVDFAVSVLGR